MPTRYGRSPWIDRFPKSRIPAYPKPRGPLNIEVAIVGGGLTGCATAYAFAAAGVKVALFEAAQLGRGGSGHSTGWIGDDPGPSFADVEKLQGLRPARHVWQAWRRAALDFAALLKRLNVGCDLEPGEALQVAATPEQIARMKREEKARRDAGLDATLINAKIINAESALVAGAAIRSRVGATIDPYRAALGLAAAAADRGARVFEHTDVRRITFTRKYADVHMAHGSVRVARVVIATSLPTALFHSLRRHFWFKSAYIVETEPVPAKIRQQVKRRSAVVRDSAVPVHTVRWVDDQRLLISGADGDTPPSRLTAKTLVQRTGQLMYELSTLYPDISGIMPAYGWEAPYALTADGLPYIGPHRNFPHHLFAFGDASAGVTGSFLASRILLRHHLGEIESGDAAFEFTR